MPSYSMFSRIFTFLVPVFFTMTITPISGVCDDFDDQCQALIKSAGGDDEVARLNQLLS